MENQNEQLSQAGPAIITEGQTGAHKLDLLQYMPVALFGSTVALSGLANAWRSSTKTVPGIPPLIGSSVGLLAWIIFVLLIISYLYKLIRFREKVTIELTHPIAANFLGTFFISAVLLSAVAAPFTLLLARITWLAGTAGGLIFVYLLTTRLYKGHFNVLDAVPPVLIPGLTVLNAVSTGFGLSFGPWRTEINQMLFSIGIVYVLVFFVIITYRLIHLDPIITFLKPTLLLLAAPFEVGFLAYTSSRTEIDAFASVLFYFGLFIFIVIFFIVFQKGLPFMVSWWGACFSMAALTNAALRYGQVSHIMFVKILSLVLLTCLTIMITITFVKTLYILITGRLLKP